MASEEVGPKSNRQSFVCSTGSSLMSLLMNSWLPPWLPSCHDQKGLQTKQHCDYVCTVSDTHPTISQYTCIEAYKADNWSGVAVPFISHFENEALQHEGCPWSINQVRYPPRRFITISHDANELLHMKWHVDGQLSFQSVSFHHRASPALSNSPGGSLGQVAVGKGFMSLLDVVFTSGWGEIMGSRSPSFVLPSLHPSLPLPGHLRLPAGWRTQEYRLIKVNHEKLVH